MPQIIRTPEDIFRDEGRDIYALHGQDNTLDPEHLEAVWSEMQQWLALHMPDSPTERMAPSEHAGFIVGGPTGLRIAFTQADLQRFCQIWETPDGMSRDPRFQCYQYSYQEWWSQHGHYQPTLAQPQAPGISVWIETPLGIVSHVMPADDITSHPATVRDLWANAQCQWPRLQAVQLDDLNHGRVMWLPGESQWLLLWNAPFNSGLHRSSAAADAHWRQTADWLRLPLQTQICSEY